MHISTFLVHINPALSHYVQTMISDKPGVRQDEELESHLNKGQFVVESPLAPFVPLQFCLCFFFLKSRVYINHQRALQGQRAGPDCGDGQLLNLPFKMYLER
jgi:hypothetical protein